MFQPSVAAFLQRHKINKLISMKSVFILVVITFSFFSSMAQRNDIVVKLVQDGIVLHDKGDYEGAIAKYDRALILDPNDYEANYEKSSSCLYAQKFDECIAISKYLLQYHKTNPGIKGVWVTYGSAYDDKGNTDSALIVYNEGIKQFPGFYLLHYNKALTYARQKKWDEATAAFFESMKNKPDHAGTLYYTALLQEKTNRVAALLSALSFLAVEPEGKRAKDIYAYVFTLFDSFAEKKGKDGGSTIYISTDDLDNKQKENNFSMTNMVMGLSMAADISDSVKGGSAVGKLTSRLELLISSLAEGQKSGKGIYWKTYVPFFIEMKQKNLLSDFAHIASITSGNEENIKWISDNQDKLKDFYEWFNAYKWQ